jgi:hypothetical protein
MAPKERDAVAKVAEPEAHRCVHRAMIVIALSRQEEDTLKLIAHGACPVDLVRAGDLDQLSRLGLLEQQDGQVALTGFGQVRLAQIKELQLRSMIRAARARPQSRAA